MLSATILLSPTRMKILYETNVIFSENRLNAYHAMGRLSRGQTDSIFIFPRKKELTFPAIVPQGDNLHEVSNPVF